MDECESDAKKNKILMQEVKKKYETIEQKIKWFMIMLNRQTPFSAIRSQRLEKS